MEFMIGRSGYSMNGYRGTGSTLNVCVNRNVSARFECSGTMLVICVLLLGFATVYFVADVDSANVIFLIQNLLQKGVQFI